jgi:RHS repeat-associated protein
LENIFVHSKTIKNVHFIIDIYIAEYYWANGQVNSRKMFGFHGDKTAGWPGNIRTRGGLLYYNYDVTGNVLGVDDRTGDTVMNYGYDAFGNLFTDMPAPYNATGYTGKTYDAAAGLMDYSARWYSPSVGRFLTEDTFMGEVSNPQSLNRYSYVMNNPVNMVDPTGHEPVPAWVRNQEDYSLKYNQFGDIWVTEDWTFDSYQRVASATTLYDTIQTNKYIQQIYHQTVTESWDYDYTYIRELYFEEDGYAKTLDEYGNTQTFSETSVLEWDKTITAQELMEQNASVIARYDAPSNARVIYSSSTLDGVPYTSEMIYGGLRAAQQYNEMMRRMREHTNPKSYLNNIISSIKSTSKKLLNNGTDFVLGASYRATDNISFGAWNNVNPYGDPRYHRKSYQAGAVFTDLLTTIEGAITTGASVTGGFALSIGSGGTASVVVVPAAVAGAAYGGAMSSRSASHLGSDLNVLFSKNGGSSGKGTSKAVSDLDKIKSLVKNGKKKEIIL